VRLLVILRKGRNQFETGGQRGLVWCVVWINVPVPDPITERENCALTTVGTVVPLTLAKLQKSADQCLPVQVLITNR